MSTKCTLDFNSPKACPGAQENPENRDPKLPDFHLYEDCFDLDGSVYLEILEPDFELDPRRLTLHIPANLWNRIIAIGPRPEGPQELLET